MPGGAPGSCPQPQLLREPSNSSAACSNRQPLTNLSAFTCGTTLASAYSVLPSRSAATVFTHGKPTTLSSESLSARTLPAVPMPSHCSSMRVLLRFGSAST
jgi:hypothetical protein